MFINLRYTLEVLYIGLSRGANSMTPSLPRSFQAGVSPVLNSQDGGVGPALQKKTACNFRFNPPSQPGVNLNRHSSHISFRISHCIAAGRRLSRDRDRRLHPAGDELQYSP